MYTSLVAVSNEVEDSDVWLIRILTEATTKLLDKYGT